jgi:acyl-CoA synthetase (AMP-forming)/AMP-acid ligase II
MSALPLTPGAIESFFERVEDASPPEGEALPFHAIAEQWRGAGLRPGDLVLLGLPNGVSLLAHFFGVLTAGGVPALVAPGTPIARLRELVTVFGARALGMMRVPGEALGAERVASIAGIEVASFAGVTAPAASEGEVVMLTSGTSGFASGCVFGLDSLLRNGARHADAIGLRPDDAMLVSLPLYFSFALVAQAMATLGRGGRLVVSGPPFHAPTYARTLRERRITVSSLTPVFVRTLLQTGSVPGEDLRVLTIGGDALSPEHVAEVVRRRRDREVYLTYGLTQAGPRVATLAAHAEPAGRYGSVGLPLADTRVSLAPLDDGSGRRQLLVASDTVMRRRIGVLEGRGGDDWHAPGLLATGDVFEQDDAGYLFHKGRLSEYILREGEKICLAAVRRVATTLPFVLSATTSVTRHDQGEDFDLTLVTAPSAEPGRPETYRAHLGRALRRGELPRSIRVVQAGQTGQAGQAGQAGASPSEQYK